jgi:hypothetical protein
MRFWATKGASNRLPSVLVRLQKKMGIYRLIFRVSALPGLVRSNALVQEILHQMGKSAFERKMCVRAQMLQNWPKLVKCDFVDLLDSFPKTQRSPQSELYNSRYDRFGGSRRVRIIARLNFCRQSSPNCFKPQI